VSARITNVLVLALAGEGELACAVQTLIGDAAPPVFSVTREVVPECDNSTRLCAGIVKRSQRDIIVLCLQSTRREWAEAIMVAVGETGGVPTLVILADGAEPKTICELLDCGAEDFITAPVRAGDLLPRLWRLRQAGLEETVLKRTLTEKQGLSEFVGESGALLSAIERIPAVAKCDVSVMLTGETGTGKELCARAIHYLSGRADGPFVPLNCGAIPVELVENELFGHEQGAYTGANSSATGLLLSADGGTVLLDEVDSLPLAAQVKLLRFLQERQFQPLGSRKTCTADIRIIAASNIDLEEATRTGQFRRDLFYRLNVIPIHLPPLRERREDIPLLARHFLQKYAWKFGKTVSAFGPGAMYKLMAYDWPGNVRELENMIERAVVLSPRSVLQGTDLALPVLSPSDTFETFRELKARTIEQFERNYLQQVLLAHEGNITRASEAAGKDRRAFWELMRKHNLTATLSAPAA
jgi:DNA-binding NtrC family response regulator